MMKHLAIEKKTLDLPSPPGTPARSPAPQAAEGMRKRAAKVVDRAAMNVERKLGRGPMLDEVTRGIVQILRGQAAAIRALPLEGGKKDA